MTRDAIVIAAWWPKWERWVVAITYEAETADPIEALFAARYREAHRVAYEGGAIRHERVTAATSGRRASDRVPAGLRIIDACHRAALAVGDLSEAERFASEHMRARSVGAGQEAA